MRCEITQSTQHDQNTTTTNNERITLITKQLFWECFLCGRPCAERWKQAYDVGTIIISTLKVRKLRHMEIRSFAQGHTCSKWQSRNLN